MGLSGTEVSGLLCCPTSLPLLFLQPRSVSNSLPRVWVNNPGAYFSELGWVLFSFPGPGRCKRGTGQARTTGANGEKQDGAVLVLPGAGSGVLGSPTTANSSEGFTSCSC